MTALYFKIKIIKYLEINLICHDSQQNSHMFFSSKNLYIFNNLKPEP